MHAGVSEYSYIRIHQTYIHVVCTYVHMPFMHTCGNDFRHVITYVYVCPQMHTLAHTNTVTGTRAWLGLRPSEPQGTLFSVSRPQTRKPGLTLEWSPVLLLLKHTCLALPSAGPVQEFCHAHPTPEQLPHTHTPKSLLSTDAAAGFPPDREGKVY